MNITNIKNININLLKTVKEQKNQKTSEIIYSSNGYNPVIYPKKYYIVGCSFKGIPFIENFKEHLRKGDDEELYNYLNNELRKKAAKKMITLDAVDDTVQDALINIYLKICDYRESKMSEDDCAEEVKTILEQLKSTQQNLMTRNGTRSLYDRTRKSEALYIIDTLTEESKLSYNSEYQDEEKIKRNKKKLETVLSKANLSPKSKAIFLDRYINSMAYPEIAAKYNLNEETVKLIVKSSMIKIQMANKTLPKKVIDNISELATTLSIDFDTAKKMILKNPYLIGKSQTKYTDHIDFMVNEFKEEGLTRKEYEQACIRYPNLLSKNPKTLSDNITETAQIFSKYGLDRKKYLQAALVQPNLFTRKAKSIYNNIINTSNMFMNNGLTLSTYIDSACKSPCLFNLPPETINKYVTDTVKMFSSQGLTTRKYINCCIKYPSLFYANSTRIEKNIDEILKRFSQYGLTKDKLIKGCIKTPSLFYQSPDTIERNVKDIVKNFEDYGLTTEDYIKSASKDSTLFTLSAETTKEKIKKIVEIFSQNGLTTEKYIKAAIKQPQLFYQLPETIKSNIEDLVKIFEKYGLTTDDYIKAALAQPPLFCMKPQTISNNVMSVIDWLSENKISGEEYIKACIKAPSLFESLPETVMEHINIYRFVTFNKKNDYNDTEAIIKILTRPIELNYSSKLTLIKHMIIPQMFNNKSGQKRLGKNNLEKNLEGYLKANPDKTYTINVKRFDTETDCIKILSEYLKEVSLKTLNRDDVYKINFI